MYCILQVFHDWDDTFCQTLIVRNDRNSTYCTQLCVSNSKLNTQLIWCHFRFTPADVVTHRHAENKKTFDPFNLLPRSQNGDRDVFAQKGQSCAAPIVNTNRSDQNVLLNCCSGECCYQLIRRRCCQTGSVAREEEGC